MKKLILLTIITTIFFSPSIALAKGGHGGGHGGHGGHHGGYHTSHTSKSGGTKSGVNTGSKGTSTVKSGSTNSTSHTSTHSVLHGGGKSAFARNAFKASSNATPVSSWKSLNTETNVFTNTTTNIPQLYRGNSATNFLLYQSLYHPRHHYIPKEEKPEDVEKEQDKELNFILNIILIVGGAIIAAAIVSAAAAAVFQ